jgi:hypothetical protein
MLHIPGVTFMLYLQQAAPAKAIAIILCNIFFFFVGKRKAVALAL